MLYHSVYHTRDGDWWRQSKNMKEMPLHFLLEWNTWNAYTIFLHRSQIFTTPNTPTPLLTENVDIIVKGNRQWLHTNIKIRHNHGEPSCPRQPVQKLHIYACITSCAITPQHVFSQSENIRKYDNYPKIWWVFIIVPIKIAIWGIDTSPFLTHTCSLAEKLRENKQRSQCWEPDTFDDFQGGTCTNDSVIPAYSNQKSS